VEAIVSILDAWYHEQRVVYAVASVVIMLVIGSLLGLLMDQVGCRLGVDTSHVRHHRKRVED